MILVDTSVWVDFLNGHETSHTRTVESLVQSREDICICGILLTELLQGIRENKAYENTKAVLSELLFLPMTRETFHLAATIYRTCRSRGITIRNSTDCMIAATCIQHGIPLLHNDQDFELIAAQFDLEFVVLV
ncbi:MAG: PIN domain nuclease [Firmicutes bacterium]|nr:PIN domain nuclease [Bacillota bacterium]